MASVYLTGMNNTVTVTPQMNEDIAEMNSSPTYLVS